MLFIQRRTRVARYVHFIGIICYHIHLCHSSFQQNCKNTMKTRKTSKKKAVVQEVGNVNDTDSDEDVKVWVGNRKCFSSELKLLEDADMQFSAEIDGEEVHANVESDEVLQPEEDEKIQDPEDLAP